MRILCVEDDLILRKFITKKCQQFGETQACRDLKAALTIIEDHQFDFALIDLNLNDEDKLDGLNVLKECVKKNIKCAVLTGHEDKNIIEQAFKLGTQQYFTKVELSENIDFLLKSFLKNKKKPTTKTLFSQKYITRHEPLIRSIEFAVEQSQLNKTILLTGPTGVGKTTVAKIIHDMTNTNGPFIAKNLNEINENLIESELFGHIKGSFTGATQDKDGLLKMADGGTLFLDEIASLPLSIQKKLLKVIEEKEFTPVGGTKPLKVDFQLISATCEDIEKNIEQGNLRVDFYFRIKGYEVTIPPLKERIHDIVPLIDFFIANSSKKIFLTNEVLNILHEYSWPGNIRELKNIIQSLILTHSGAIQVSDLPQALLKGPHSSSDEIESFLSPKNLSYIKQHGLPDLIKKIEQEAFHHAQKEYGERINKISRELRISKSVYYRLASLSKDETSHG